MSRTASAKVFSSLTSCQQLTGSCDIMIFETFFCLFSTKDLLEIKEGGTFHYMANLQINLNGKLVSILYCPQHITVNANGEWTVWWFDPWNRNVLTDKYLF
jgi:hypothetical protein